MYDSQLLFNWNNVFWGANLLLAQLSVRDRSPDRPASRRCICGQRVKGGVLS